MKILINRNVLIAMQGMASRDASRMAITGILVESKGADVFVVATDGRRMAAIKSGKVVEPAKKDQPTSFSFVADTKLIKALCCSGDVILEFSDGVVACRNESEKQKSVTMPTFDTKFPTWRQVIPKGVQPEPISPTFNWNLLNSFAKAIGILSGNPPTMSVRQGDPKTAMTIFSDDVPDFLGILMPISTNHKLQTPEWATQ